MKVWITTYALTSGVIETDGAPTAHCSGGVRYTRNGSTLSSWGKNWHKSKEAADERVREMIRKKYKSLAEQVARLDKLADQYGVTP